MREKVQLFLFAFSTLSLELALTRILDVLFYPAMTYFLITLALTGLSLAGFVFYFFEKKVKFQPAVMAAAFAITAVSVYPILSSSNLLSPESLNLVSVLVLSAILLMPFIISGCYILSVFVSAPKKSFYSFYFIDMVGAALAAIVSFTMVNKIGPQGLILLSCALLILFQFILKTKRRASENISLVVAILFLVGWTVNYQPNEYIAPISKKYLDAKVNIEQVEYSSWRGTSRIDVVDYEPNQPDSIKYVHFNGGSIGTKIHPFDGDFTKLKEVYLNDPLAHFTRLGAVVSHFLKRDTSHSAFLVGVGAGQELKAALMYGANPIVANEINPHIIELVRNNYSNFNGDIFRHPNVEVLIGDGRAVLLQQQEKFDIIQIFSNYLSSLMSQGRTNLKSSYLFTVEAFEDYFQKLNSDGILHINQYRHNQLLVMAQEAWKRQGQSDFSNHVIVVESEGPDFLPTTLIKKSAWIKNEVEEVQQFFAKHPKSKFKVTHPYKAQFFGASFYDDKPYFAHSGLSKSLTNESYLLIFALMLFVVLLLLAGSFYAWNEFKDPLVMKSWMYFFVIGSGFIVYQLATISIFLKVVGHPHHNYIITISGMLIGVAIGSLLYPRFQSSSGKAMLVGCFGLFLLAVLYPQIQSFLLMQDQLVRMLLSALIIILFTIPLGIYFPRGWDQSLTDKWQMAFAWMYNGLGILFGGILLAQVLPILGFRATLVVAGLFYLAGWLLILTHFRKRKSL